MENDLHNNDPTPPDCFRLEELQTLQSFEKQVLADANYFIWHHQAKPREMPHRFLFALELVFETGESLLLSSGEDSESIRLITAEDLAKTARLLQRLHGKPLIQRVLAGIQPQWRQVMGKVLQGIRLSRNEAELFLNDALLLDFGEREILVRLSEKEGLLIGEMPRS